MSKLSYVFNVDSGSKKNNEQLFSNTAKILSTPEVFVQVGNAVSLECEITPDSGTFGMDFTTLTKPRVRWFHKGTELTFEVRTCVISLFLI